MSQKETIIPVRVVFTDSEKGIGRTIGNAARPNKPGYDGDGDGFIVNPATGRDDVPFKGPVKEIAKYLPTRDRDPNNSFDELETDKVKKSLASNRSGLEAAKKRGDEKSEKEYIKLIDQASESLKKRGLTDEDIEKAKNTRTSLEETEADPDLAFAQLEANAPVRYDGDVAREARRRNANKYLEYKKRGGQLSRAEWEKRSGTAEPIPLNPTQARRYIDPSEFLPLPKKTTGTKPEKDKPAAPQFELKPKPDNPGKENPWESADSEDIFKRMNQTKPFLKKLQDAVNGTGKPPSQFRQGQGQTTEAHQMMLRSALKTELERMKQMQDALKKRGYEDGELARLEYNRSNRGEKSLLFSTMLTDEEYSMNIRIEKD